MSERHEKLCVSVGDVVCGKYLVERVIGIGGMAFVVAARHLALEERVALKFLASDFAKRTDFVERFSREAKASCRLRSKHVARVYDVGMHELTPFIVMEHLTGRDLSSVLADTGTIPIEEAVEYAMQACEALATAHASGIAHRDIKPENLFRVEDEGIPHVKLLDFGISKETVTGGDPVSTLTGNLSMGTPSYMAPEHIRSTASADERSDIWSLGVVLYEILAGAPPFMAPSISELCAAVLEEEPAPLDEIYPVIPRGLAEVVARCLEKDPARRFPNVHELAHALMPYAPSRAIAHLERAESVLNGAPSGASSLTRLTPPAIAIATPITALSPVLPQKKRRVTTMTIALGLSLSALGALGAFVASGGARPTAVATHPPVAIEAPVAPIVSVTGELATAPAAVRSGTTTTTAATTTAAAMPTLEVKPVALPAPILFKPVVVASTPHASASTSARTTETHAPAASTATTPPVPGTVELGY